MGPRQIEKPVVRPGTPRARAKMAASGTPSTGPVILGLSTSTAPPREDLLRRMTFANFAQNFPDYWTGQWSASDSLDSSLVKPTASPRICHWCAHAHAWPLYCWLRLQNGQ